MITCVYSISGGASSSRSSSCAAPRMPPSGFLISCARLRISSRFACCCSLQPLLARDLELLVDVAELDAAPTRRRGRPASPCTTGAACGLPVARELDLLLGVGRRRSTSPWRSRRRARRCRRTAAPGRRFDELLARELEQVLGGRIRPAPRGRRRRCSSTAVASSSRPAQDAGVAGSRNGIRITARSLARRAEARRAVNTLDVSNFRAERALGERRARRRARDQRAASSRLSASTLRSCSCTVWRSRAIRSAYLCALVRSSGSGAGAPSPQREPRLGEQLLLARELVLQHLAAQVVARPSACPRRPAGSSTASAPSPSASARRRDERVVPRRRARRRAR